MRTEPSSFPPTPEEERQLALAFQSGDVEAYECIHERYASRVEAICRRMLGHREDAQEASQEAFLRVYQALPRFNGRYQLGAWITRITTNVCLDAIRTRARKPSDATALELLDLEESGHPEDTDPQHLFIRKTEGRRVRRVLASLPPMHRAAIVLRDFEGLSYEEIAVALGITECQVKALLHRARKGFKRSWPVHALSLLAPTRALARLRRHDATGEGQGVKATVTSSPQVADVAASSAQIAASCGGVLQQCGQVLSERVAAVVTATMVGTAAIGAATASDVRILEVGAAKPGSTRVVQVTRAADEPKAGSGKTGRAPGPRSDTPGGSEATPEETSTGAAAAPSPTPSPSPSPTPSPTPTASASPTPPPEPAGFRFGFSVDLAASGPPCSCAGPTQVDREVVSATQAGLEYYQQSLTGTAEAAGTPSYGVHLKHASNSGDYHSVDLSLYTDEGGYMYTVSGRLERRSRTDWGGWTYRYLGTYRLSSRPTSNEVLPTQGTYVADITFSVKRQAVVSTIFSLAEAR